MNHTKQDISVQFFGVRGSTPTPPVNHEIESKIEHALLKACTAQLRDPAGIAAFMATLAPWEKGLIGGNTSCVYVRINGKHIIFDAGSGIRRLGDLLMRQEFGEGKGEVHIFMSHTHWDHIQGFPFFTPAFISGNTIIFYGPHNTLEQRISNQQEDEYFPVPFSALSANIDFIQLRKGESFNLDGITISNQMLNHPGGSFGYRLDFNGKSVVYATDSEYKNVDLTKLASIQQFFHETDLLIFDAQYTLAESIEKENWGHSTSIRGVDIALSAAIKHLVLFHHDPNYSDSKLIAILNDAIEYLHSKKQLHDLQISLAAEGLEIVI